MIVASDDRHLHRGCAAVERDDAHGEDELVAGIFGPEVGQRNSRAIGRQSRQTDDRLTLGVGIEAGRVEPGSGGLAVRQGRPRRSRRRFGVGQVGWPRFVHGGPRLFTAVPGYRRDHGQKRPRPEEHHEPSVAHRGKLVDLVARSRRSFYCPPRDSCGERRATFRRGIW